MDFEKTNIKNRNKSISLAIIIETIRIKAYPNLYRFKFIYFGFNIYIIFSPIIAGFVETRTSQKFPMNLFEWNIFTISGLFLVIQAAIYLTVNYIVLGLLFVFTYVFEVVYF